MHFSLVSQEKKGFTNIWIKQNTFIGVTFFQIWLRNMKFWTFVCLFVYVFVCNSGFANFAKWKMVQAWFQYLNSSQGCDIDGNCNLQCWSFPLRSSTRERLHSQTSLCLRLIVHSQGFTNNCSENMSKIIVNSEYEVRWAKLWINCLAPIAQQR